MTHKQKKSERQFGCVTQTAESAQVSQTPMPEILPPLQFTAEQQANMARAYKAMKWSEYDAKTRELQRTYEARFTAAMNAVHQFADEARWFG